MARYQKLVAAGDYKHKIVMEYKPIKKAGLKPAPYYILIKDV
jgi:hypothetical protein